VANSLFLYLIVIYLFTDAHAVFVFGFNMSRHFTSAAAATTTICCPGCGLNILFAGPILIFICSALRLHLSDAEIRKFSVAVRFKNRRKKMKFNEPVKDCGSLIIKKDF